MFKAEAQKSAIATNPDAQDLAMRCVWVARNAGLFGKEAEAGYRLCEQRLDADPNNLLALNMLTVKFYMPVMLGQSTDPQADLKRACELVSRALALDANYALSHHIKGQLLSATNVRSL
jgi:hypothetical protein